MVFWNADWWPSQHCMTSCNGLWPLNRLTYETRMRLVSDLISLYWSVVVTLSPHNSTGVLFRTFQGHTRKVAAGHPRSGSQDKLWIFSHGLGGLGGLGGHSSNSKKLTIRISLHFKGFEIEVDPVTRRDVNEPMALKWTWFRTCGVFFREVRTVDDTIALPRDVSAAFWKVGICIFTEFPDTGGCKRVQEVAGGCRWLQEAVQVGKKGAGECRSVQEHGGPCSSVYIINNYIFCARVHTI